MLDSGEIEIKKTGCLGIKTNRSDVPQAFIDAVCLYPGYKKSIPAVWAAFKKKYKDYRSIIPKIRPAIEAQIAFKDRERHAGKFVPEWQHLPTWINARGWEYETPSVEHDPIPDNYAKYLTAYNIGGEPISTQMFRDFESMSGLFLKGRATMSKQRALAIFHAAHTNRVTQVDREAELILLFNQAFSQ